jgi:hypothetical protein
VLGFYRAFNLIADNLGINLGCGNISVTQHLLHGAQISAVFQKVGRESVTQNVRADAFRVDSGVA